VVRGGVIRGTLHLLSRADYPSVAAAYTAPQRRHATERLSVDVDTLGAAMPEEPITGREIRALAERVIGPRDDPWTVAFALRALPFVDVPPAGTWRHYKAGRARLWREPLPDVAEATALLVRRFLSAFGPASRNDVEHFTYLPVAQLKPALEGLRRLQSDDGRELYDVPRGPLPSPDTPAPARFLPTFDSAVLAHADRTRILPAAYHETVIRRKNATTLATFLVDGFVAGSWRLERARRGATLRLQPFEPLPRRALRELKEEAERLLRFLEPDAESYAVRLAGSA